MRVGLITPLWHGAHFNPGCNQITAGIRYLVRRVVSDAVFVPIEMMRDIPEHWETAQTCDVLILCGNPRFTLSGPSFWECDIWHRLAGMQAAGIRVIDGWSGASHTNVPETSLEEMADAILAFPRTAHYLKVASKIHRRITRDPLMQLIYAKSGIASTLLPCSSWWAALEYGVTSGKRDCNAVAIYAGSWGPEPVRVMIEQTGQARVIASTWNDYAWARGHGIAAELIPDPRSILRVLARCTKVTSMRLHAAIPAASLGCEVVGVSIDSRTLTLEPFGVKAVALDRIGEEPLPFGIAKAPDEAAVLKTLREAL